MTFARIDELESAVDRVSGFERRCVQTGTMTLAFIKAKAGEKVPAHAHPNEQITLILDGLFELTINAETRRLQPGWLGVIPAGAPHAAHAVEDSVIIEIFCPPRMDFS